MSKEISLSKLFLQLSQDPKQLDNFLQNPETYLEDLKPEAKKILQTLTNRYTLSTLFHSLGTDDNLLKKFIKDPTSFNDQLSKPEQERLQAFLSGSTKNLNESPTDVPLFPGNFYFGADEGSTIYQLYSTQLAPLTPAKANIPQTTTYSINLTETVDNDEDENPIFSLTESQPITAMQHFNKIGGSRVNSFHKVEIKIANIEVDHWPKGECILPMNDNAIRFNSSYEAVIDVHTEGAETNISVKGDGVFPQNVSSSDEPIIVKLNKKNGYITLDAPGNFLTIPFGKFKNTGPFLPNGGPVIAGSLYLTTTNNQGEVEVYQLYSTTSPPLSAEPQSEMSHQHYSIANNRIPDRIPMATVQKDTQSTIYGLIGISERIGAVRVYRQALSLDGSPAAPPNTYHGVTLLNLQLKINDSPLPGFITKYEILNVNLNSPDEKSLELTVEFQNGKEPEYLYIDGPYIKSKKLTPPFNHPIKVNFTEYQGYMTLLTTGSYHEIDLPIPPPI